MGGRVRCRPSLLGARGPTGLGDAAAADDAFASVWFAWLNAGAGVAFAVAAGLALVSLRHGMGVPATRVLHRGLWATAVVLLLRGGGGLTQLILSQRTTAEELSPVLAWYDPWFVAGGAAFAVVAWGHGRRLRRA